MTTAALLLAVALAVAAPGPEPTALPAGVDLTTRFRKLGLSPRAQGGRDVCSLFAVTALAEFETGDGPVPTRQGGGGGGGLSEEFLIWAADAATGRRGDQAMFYEAVRGLETLGVCRRELMPFADASDPRRRPAANALADAKHRAGCWEVHWVRRWNLARPLDDAELRGVKEALAAGHPVACGFRWPKTLRGDAIMDVPPPQDVFDGHSVAVVGYDDDPARPGGGSFVFRNSNGPLWGEHGYGRLSYAYARAYANDALWLRLVPRASATPVERFEAEALPVVGRDGADAAPQDMADFGGRMWSGGRQLFVRARDGASVTLGISVRRAGRYRLRVRATAAPDFATVRFAVDGKALGPAFSLYSGRVSPSGPLDVGPVTLAAGRHALRATATGKDPASSGFFFGLDAVELLPPG